MVLLGRPKDAETSGFTEHSLATHTYNTSSTKQIRALDTSSKVWSSSWSPFLALYTSSILYFCWRSKSGHPRRLFSTDYAANSTRLYRLLLSGWKDKSLSETMKICSGFLSISRSICFYTPNTRTTITDYLLTDFLIHLALALLLIICVCLPEPIATTKENSNPESWARSINVASLDSIGVRTWNRGFSIYLCYSSSGPRLDKLFSSLPRPLQSHQNPFPL